ncbi:hypothetical protein OKW35_006950 [Paraburkholderia sp. MM5477-R1]
MNFVVRASGSKPDSASARQLELAVAVGEVREHVEREPVRRFLVERAENARVVLVARATAEQGFGFLTTVAAEVAMQQVHHRPQVAAFLDVDLEQVAKIVQRRRGQTEVTLLLDRGRFRIALRDDDAAQVRAMLAGHVLPRGFALVLAELDLAILLARREENAPAVLGHLHVVEVRPAARIDADRGAQIHVVTVRAFRAHVAPP